MCTNRESPNSNERSGSSEITNVDRLLDGVRTGDHLAAEKLWKRYWPRLLTLADRRMARYRRRELDEEDVALSAMRTFLRRAELGQFDGLDDEPALWNLLCVILARKVYAAHRKQEALKRSASKSMSLDEEPAANPRIDDEVIFAETLAELLEAVGSKVEPFVILRLEGNDYEEIAERLGVSTRTVERRISEARVAWTQLKVDS